MATWLCPGPRFWTLNPATFAAIDSMFSAPRSRIALALSAAMENGTSASSCSRNVAVTVTACRGKISSEKSTGAVRGTRTLVWETRR